MCNQNVFLDGSIDVEEPLGADSPSQYGSVGLLRQEEVNLG